ncbi:circadian clock-controlled protein daywake-like [Bacillus rossius redtenbacheri]|uniref:circadian clock-controlled protein daywake-like n=1 Tax=Bacillus rossius redtenbacheri TaxID=93214 RepID=UPI002FDF0898
MFRAASLLVGLLATVGSALKLAPYLKPCSRNDPNLDECTLKHGIEAIPQLIKGDPKYGIPVLDPVAITEIRIEDPDKDKKPTGIDIVLRDIQIRGLQHAVLTKARYDLKGKKVEVTADVPNIWLTFKYEIDGKILAVPIVGKGDGSLNMSNVNLFYNTLISLVKKEDGLEYMHVDDFKFNYKTKNTVWHLDNLFNGNKALGESTNAFLNENWQLLNSELGPHFAQAIGDVAKQIIVGITNVVPYDEFFPEKV